MSKPKTKPNIKPAIPFGIDQFVLTHCFNKLEVNGEVYYWRDCVQADTDPFKAGYIIVYADGEHFHTYNHPESFMK